MTRLAFLFVCVLAFVSSWHFRSSLIVNRWIWRFSCQPALGDFGVRRLVGAFLAKRKAVTSHRTPKFRALARALPRLNRQVAFGPLSSFMRRRFIRTAEF